ncbi:phospholipase D-like protein [Litoreibacter ponti]|uniref:Phospholipase D-like protein n=1 Tax=Litoreibacter ponti TaxID=1510457 RepID=A0A2T6BNU9_9RHOB|nr:PLD nuclease N-terminal domain-containing protein [Litoreibacter ponti]PTX57763.1 phospholipase D-like protein [Litoreibacter ponti]
MGINGLLGLIVFALDVWAIASIFSAKVETGQKVLWIALVLILPLIGFIIWYFAGPKPAK